MGELDQNQATTSTFHSNEMNEENVKMKRIQRFKRQFSIFIHGNGAEVSRKKTEIKNQDDCSKDDKVFKYPGSLRGIKRKRTYTKQPIINKCARRKLFAHQDSIHELPTTTSEDPIEAEKKTEPSCKTENSNRTKNDTTAQRCN